MHVRRTLTRLGAALLLGGGMSACVAGNGADPRRDSAGPAETAASSPSPSPAPAPTTTATAAAAMANPATGRGDRTAPAEVGELPPEGAFQRFIIKYRDGSAPASDPAAVPARLDAAAAGLGPPPVRIEWLRRLAVDADVIKASRPLQRDEATRLMQRFAADPDVEYIEIDGVVTIRTGVDVPPVRPLGG